MKSKSKTITIESEEALDIVDITDKVINFLEDQSIEDGIVNIQTQHTTATIFLNENEPLLLKDIKANLKKLAPEDMEYNHDNFDVRTVNMCEDECANGHAHCRAIYLPSNLTLNLIEGELQLGQWQRILFIELDRSRTRNIQIHLLGE